MLNNPSSPSGTPTRDEEIRARLATRYTYLAFDGEVRCGAGILSSDIDYLLGALREAETRIKELRARLKLVDNVCHSHHAASLVTWEGGCPVCDENGGVAFYVENARLYRAGYIGDGQ